MRYTYLIVDLATIFIPLLFSFHPKIKFYDQWKSYLPALFISAFLFIAWDILYTYLGVWSFNPNYLSGLYLLNLPMEECLFFICIPYACVFTYYSLTKLNQLDLAKNTDRNISIGLSITLILLALLNYSKLYTFATFFLLAISLALLKFYFKVQWLERFFISYLVLLIPFFVVNGVLTGTGINEAIVQYDDTENLGLRIGTIPVEDIFYGMLLILTNVSLYEYFKTKKGLLKSNPS